MEILKNTTADILIYNIPIFTGMNIEPETVGRLAAESKRFIGIKDESGINPVQIIDYEYAVKDSNPDFLIYNGDDIMLMPTIACGAIGVVSGGSLLIGDRVKKIFKCYEEGKNDEALALYHDAFKICRINGINGRIHPNPMLRAAVEMITGIEVGPARPPLDAPTKAEKEALKKVLAELRLI
jgi:4-hydroxy-tetrahydrodipicolinate synthase